ncbi:MAG: MMPL family transporter [Immundisolibacteraceae bacterium]|nr:MMPL family transporter [Immundisolibacteraceae bacterium]
MSGFALEANMLALLPNDSGDAWVEEASAIVANKIGNRVVLVVGHTGFDRANQALQSLLFELERQELGVRQSQLSTQQIESFHSRLLASSSGLLSRSDRQLMQTERSKELVQRARAQLFSPILMVGGGTVSDDPLFLFSRFLADKATISAQKMQFREGLLTREHDGKHFVLATLLLTGEPFDQNFQQRFSQLFSDTRQQLIQADSGLQVLATGALFYASDAVEQGRRDSLLIGSVSLLAVIGLLVGLFGSLRPLLLSLLSISGGLIGGLAVILLLFEKIHLIALVFGAGIIGISVDYAIHYFSEGLGADPVTPAQKLNRVLPALTLGMISSVIGFATLAQAPFPGLRQIAVFSAVGLVCAYMTVVTGFTWLDKKTAYPHSNRLLALAKQFDRLVHRWVGDHAAIVLLVILVGGGVTLARTLVADDDLRQQQTVSAELKEQEHAIRSLSGVDNATQFFLVSGSSSEAVLRAEEQLTSRLDQLIDEGQITGYNSISTLVPSAQRQAENQALLRRHQASAEVGQYYRSLGLSTVARAGPENMPLRLNQLNDAGGDHLSGLLVSNEIGRVVHMVTLSGVVQLKPLEQAAIGLNSVQLVDQTSRWSQVLETYRQRAIALLMVAVGLIWLFLSWRYRPLRAAIIVAVPTAAVVLTPLVTSGLLGEPFTFFSAMGLMLVLMMGIDFALFYAEAPEPQRPVSLFANGLSAISTMLAFGLMSLSATYAVHAFGITILVGISLALLLSPLAARRA